MRTTAGAAAGNALVERVALDDLRDASGQLAGARLVFGRQRSRDDLGDLDEVVVLQPARGERRRADAQAGRLHRRTRVERDRVAIDGDVDRVQAVLGLPAGQLWGARSQVDEHEVHFGAAAEHIDAVPRLRQLPRPRARAVERAALT